MHYLLCLQLSTSNSILQSVSVKYKYWYKYHIIQKIECFCPFITFWPFKNDTSFCCYMGPRRIPSTLKAGKGNASADLILTDSTFLRADVSHLAPALHNGSLAPLSVRVRINRATLCVKRMNGKLLPQRSDYIHPCICSGRDVKQRQAGRIRLFSHWRKEEKIIWFLPLRWLEMDSEITGVSFVRERVRKEQPV